MEIGFRRILLYDIIVVLILENKLRGSDTERGHNYHVRSKAYSIVENQLLPALLLIKSPSYFN